MPKRYDAGEVITAMVTPFDKNLKVNYDKAADLAKYLINNGSDGLVLAGTTGESPTLTNEEELEILSTVRSAIGNSGKIIFGAGSNSTETAIKMSKLAEKEGADAVLSVVPYYNKPSQAGMIAHFSAIAESTNLPIVMYNIPSRTGVNMAVSTMKTLAEKYSNIVAVKQSFGDMNIISEIKRECPEDFVVYSGDDSLTLPMISVGAHGVVSVASHIIGNEIKTMIHNFKNGNYNVAKNMHLELYPVFQKIFMAPNPVPIKAELARRGLLEEYVRKPLVTLTEEEKTELFETIDKVTKELA